MEWGYNFHVKVSRLIHVHRDCDIGLWDIRSLGRIEELECPGICRAGRWNTNNGCWWCLSSFPGNKALRLCITGNVIIWRWTSTSGELIYLKVLLWLLQLHCSAISKSCGVLTVDWNWVRCKVLHAVLFWYLYDIFLSVHFSEEIVVITLGLCCTNISAASVPPD